MNTMMLKYHRQRGLTLVEIMVALVISLFLLAGLLQLFVGTRQSSRVQENLSRVQENGRFAIDYLGRIVRLTSYRSRFTIEQGQSFDAAFPAVQAIQGTNDDGSNSSDTVTIAYEGEGAGQGDIRNCLNAQINNNTIASNTLSINNNSLQCRARTLTPAGAVVSDQTQPIVENIENIQILYGQNTDNDIWRVADRYIPANNVNDWSQIVSIRISLLLRTAENNLVDSPQPYNFNGATIDPGATDPSDRRLRRVFTTTITLRNQG